MSIIIAIIFFILGIFAGRHFKRSIKPFNPFSEKNDFSDSLDELKEDEKQFKIISPSKIAMDKKLEKELNDNL